MPEFIQNQVMSLLDTLTKSGERDSEEFTFTYLIKRLIEQGKSLDVTGFERSIHEFKPQIKRLVARGDLCLLSKDDLRHCIASLRAEESYDYAPMPEFIQNQVVSLLGTLTKNGEHYSENAFESFLKRLIEQGKSLDVTGFERSIHELKPQIKEMVRDVFNRCERCSSFRGAHEGAHEDGDPRAQPTAARRSDAQDNDGCDKQTQVDSATVKSNGFTDGSKSTSDGIHQILLLSFCIVDPLTSQNMSWQSWLDTCFSLDMGWLCIYSIAVAYCNLLGLRYLVRQSDAVVENLTLGSICVLVYYGFYVTPRVTMFLGIIAAKESTMTLYEAYPDHVDDLFVRLSFVETARLLLPLVVFFNDLLAPELIWVPWLAFGLLVLYARKKRWNLVELACTWVWVFYWELTLQDWLLMQGNLSLFKLLMGPRALWEGTGLDFIAAFMTIYKFIRRFRLNRSKYGPLLSLVNAIQLLRRVYWSFQLGSAALRFDSVMTWPALRFAKILKEKVLKTEQTMDRKDFLVLSSLCHKVSYHVRSLLALAALLIVSSCAAWGVLETLMNTAAADSAAMYIMLGLPWEKLGVPMSSLMNEDSKWGEPRYRHWRAVAALCHTCRYGFRQQWPYVQGVLFFFSVIAQVGARLDLKAMKAKTAERTGTIVEMVKAACERRQAEAEAARETEAARLKAEEAKAEAEARRSEAEARRRREAEIKAARQATAAAETKARAKADAEARRQREAEMKAARQATAAAEAKAREEAAAEARRQREAEMKAARQATTAAEAKAKEEAEAEARRQREAEMKAARHATAAAEATAGEEAEAEVRRRHEAATSSALKDDGAADSRLLAFLASIGQEHTLQLFANEEVDFETLEMCGPTELSDMLTSLGLKIGTRKKIITALSESSAAAKSSEIDRLNRRLVEDSAKHQEALGAHRAQLDKLRGAMKQSGVPREYECPIRRVNYV